ncbi:hypothetical protein F5Y19DRAFT_447177 [Xylariaceae sp. FL1651]|nr:hypothetical protein F5Y19DRAFT_447177 [Xylariaceae sp. FL1651]
MFTEDDLQPAAKRRRLETTLENSVVPELTCHAESYPLLTQSGRQEQHNHVINSPDEQGNQGPLSEFINWSPKDSQDFASTSMQFSSHQASHSEDRDYVLPDNSQLPNTRSPPISDTTIPSCKLKPPSVDKIKENSEESGKTVCFGMIFGLAATFERQASHDLPASFEVQFDSSSRFSSKDCLSVRGRVQTEHGQMLEGLLDEKTLILRTICTVDARPVAKKRSRTYMMWPCTLDITVYGPFNLCAEIGVWFQDYEVYLQDPRVCHLDTIYCNPHRLSSSINAWPLVSEVVSKNLFMAPMELPERPDFLDILSSHIDLEETPQPSAIRTALKSHQKQALTFMLDREQGWGFNRGQADIWEIIDTGGRRLFLNTISHVCQPEEPLSFFGGIIADPMGFGKTLTMIALVATDIEAGKMADTCIEDLETSKPDIPVTLVIIPPPLIGTWEEQLFDHVVDGGLVCRRHHGKTRITGISEFDAVNIVLTTYHTVSADWKASQDAGPSPLFAVRWKRIILDEAHFIRNGNARMARAVCELESISRWVVTGTPIQNRLGDLASLLKFIRAYPYTDPKHFDADVSRPWKSGEDKEAVKRLKRLSACLLLRRPKGAIDLPPRKDLVCHVDFTQEERAVYEQIRHQTITNIDEALGNDTGPSKPYVYVNVLQQIESLRLFSNLGLHYLSRHTKTSQKSSELEQWKSNAQQAFNSQREMTSIVCFQCSAALGLTETLLDDSAHATESARFTSCLKFTCSECASKTSHSGQTASCGHTPSCPVASVSTSGIALEEVESFIAPQAQISLALPSKIKALLEDIRRVPSDVKCIVFSTWRLTLDLITRGLRDEGIPNIRFDGKVPQKDRHSVISAFNSDPTLRVMLLTLSCGAVGLTLTAASRAYLMEPHWNPTLEEQALARIHRLGQSREVKTIRFYVRDSFEEQVMKVQESKKQLAGVLLSPHDSEQTNDNLGTLEKLRSLL